MKQPLVPDRDARGADPVVAATEPTLSYSVVHIVTGETRKDLVVPQVVTHMMQQAEIEGPLRPRRVVVLFLEAARIAAKRSVRAWVREVRAGVTGVKIVLVPCVSRLGMGTNARALSHLVRRWTRGGDVVFHCRGEWAVLWAAELSRRLWRAGIVADIRGAWPEEALAMRGLDGLENADSRGMREYRLQLATVRTALAHAAQVLTVSPGMIEWLRELGVAPDRVHYVPSCVPRLTYSCEAREDVRRELGLGDALVYAFMGSSYSYATIGDGLVLFMKATFERFADVRLLMLTDRPEAIRAKLEADGIPSARIHALRVRHHDVWRYLSAADCGCILKAPGRLNRTWQPVKLGEYLAAGLPVVVSRGVGQVDDLIGRAGAGTVVDLFENSDAPALEANRVYRLLRSHGDRMRIRALQLCEEQFLWSRYVDTVRKAYVRALEP